MSLFNRKAHTEFIRKDFQGFKIHQFVKIEGLKQKGHKKFKSSDFISPIFGLSVKDETVAPFIIKNTGDVKKRYDAFRTKPMTDLSEYAEFKSTILNNQTRKDIFGQDSVINKERKYEDERKKPVELTVPFNQKNKEIPTFTNPKPQKTVYEEKVVSSDFEYIQSKPIEDRKSVV